MCIKMVGFNLVPNYEATINSSDLLVLLTQKEGGLLHLPVEIFIVILVRPVRAVEEHKHQQHPAPPRTENHHPVQRTKFFSQAGWRGGSMVAHQTVVLQSRVRIRHLPSPQQTANLLEGCHLGWHFAEGWPLWGATEEKIMKMPKTYKEKKSFFLKLIRTTYLKKNKVHLNLEVDIDRHHLWKKKIKRVGEKREQIKKEKLERWEGGKWKVYVYIYV